MILAILLLALSGAGLQPAEPQAGHPSGAPAPRGEHACVQVSGESILVRDLAGALPALAALPPEETLGYAPAPGVRRLVTRAELARLAGRHGVRLEAGPGLCVERAAQRLTRERVEAAVRAALTQPGQPEPRMRLIEFSGHPVPEGELQFSRSGLPTPPRAGAPVVWRGRLRYGVNRSLPVWARVSLAAEGEGVIAAASLPAGRPIEAHQVRLGPVSWFPLAEAPLAELAQVLGRIPRRAIVAGTPLPASLLLPAHEIGRGETVDVEVSSGAAQLRFQARAESSGNAGDSVLLRNPSTGRTFSGRVEARGKVVVNADTFDRSGGGWAVVPPRGGRGPR